MILFLTKMVNFNKCDMEIELLKIVVYWLITDFPNC